MAQIKNLNGDNNTYMNQNMILSIVTLATKEVEGVVDVYKSKELTLKRLFNKNVGKGVRIKHTKTGTTIDIHVIVSTDCEVNDVVYKIQQNVKNSISTLLPIEINAINVYIKDAEKTSL